MEITVEKREVRETGSQFSSYKYGGILKLRHQKKPRGFRGSSEAEVNQAIDLYLSQEKAVQDKMAANRAESRAKRLEANHLAAKKVKVGDIFESSWGYEQTNVDFYEVTAIRGKIAELRPISGKSLPHESAGYSPMSGRKVPNPGSYTGEAEARLIQADYKGEPCFHLTSYSSAYRWDGKPRYESWYA